jgi:hypothetical protein
VEARVYQRTSAKQKTSVNVSDSQVESDGNILGQQEVRLDLNVADRVAQQRECPFPFDRLDDLLSVVVPIYELAPSSYLIGSRLETA